MKRLAISILILTIAICLIPAYARENPKKIPVFVNETLVRFDVQPVEKGGRVFVPFRAIAEALGVSVKWDSSKQIIYASNDKAAIRLMIGSKVAYRNEERIKLDVSPIAIKGRVLIPLRFFSEAFASKVEWDNNIYGVKIVSAVKELDVFAYYALGDSKTSSWKNLFKKDYPEVNKGNTGLVSDLALGWYSLDEQGNLLTKSTTGWQRPLSWEKVLEASHEYNLPTEMVVHLTNKNHAISNMVADNKAVKKAVVCIAQEAQQYQGVNLDFEGLGLNGSGESLAADRNNFTKFVSLLADKLKEENKSLSLSLHPLNSVYKGYDYQALGRLADKIIIMAYEYGVKPEPNELVSNAVELAREEVPAQKLILGISADSETPESLLNKIEIAKQYHLKGIAIWRLGLISEDMWLVLQNNMKVAK